MPTIPRSAGTALLVYGLGVTAAFMTLGAPGGAYEPTKIARYLSSDHWMAAFTLAYVGALAAVALLVFGHALRSSGVLGSLGEFVWGATVAGTACSVVGAFVTGGLDVVMAEGGRTVQTALPAPVVYAIGEIGNLLTVCAPAFFVGVIAIVLAAKAPLPRWLRAFSALAGVCGILAPLFFTYFVFVLWTAVTGGVILAGRRGVERHAQPAAEPAFPTA